MNSMSSLYLHFPFCRHLCNYCDFYKNILEDEDQITGFEKILDEQFIKHANFLKEQSIVLKPLQTFYIGGGTPSLWGERGVRKLRQILKNQKIQLDKNCEFTLEVDPDAWDVDALNKWFEFGVNRVSVGVQAFDDRVLKVLDRQHNKKEIIKTLKFLENKNFSIDLLVGVPDKNANRDIISELKELIQYNPSHFSVYILKTRKNYPHKLNLPSDDISAVEYLEVCRFLEENGYQQYEVSNFAKDKKYSRHNLRYWQYENVGGVGPNATGLFSVNDNRAIRYQWKSLSANYQTELIEGDSLKIEKIFLALRNINGFEYKTLFSADSDIKKIEKLARNWRQSGYLVPGMHEQKIVLNSKGYLMTDSIIDDIFRVIDF